MTQRKPLLEDDGTGHQGYDELDEADLPASALLSGGALGTPSSGTATNLTGTAAGLTAGTVTTNANLTGDVTSSGNATTIGSGKVTEAMQVLADNTTQDVSTSKHGYAPKAPNDATKFLDGTGAYTVPPAGGGALVLLEQHTASASATLDFTAFISSTYDDYMFELLDVIPATDNVNLYMRVGTGGGPTYQTSNYAWSSFRWSNTGSAVSGAPPGGPNGFFGLDGAGGVDNGSTYGIWGSARLSGAQSAINKKMTGSFGYVDNAGSPIGSTLAGQWMSTTAITAVRFLFSSGNITSGIIRVYGVAK